MDVVNRGGATPGRPKSDAWKESARAAWTPERKAAARQRMLGNKFGPGRKAGVFNHTEESKKKLSHAHKGKITREDGISSEDPRAIRERKMRYRYHVEPEWYEAQLAAQGGHCALCPAIAGYGGRLLSVDHDHKCCGKLGQGSGYKEKLCGKCLRGLLCDNCNNIVGKLEQLDLGWAERALAYLEKYRKPIL